MIQFDIPKEKSSIIKVFGVGGGGSNAVNHMYQQGIQGVNYVICNTDNQALEMSDVPNKIQLGSSLREGLGAGSKPEIGREATEEAIDQIEEILQTNTKMVFITAGMGGGTGTGGAPVVARLSKDMGILTVGIVTTPFVFEGKKRKLQADAGIEELKKEVDALLVISNDKLRDIHGNLKMSEAFGRADDILTVAAKGIAEIITKIGYVNVDFEDVNTVMRDSGVALMGIGTASGEDRAIVAIEQALNSPLLNDNNIIGAKSVLLNISYGDSEIMMDEMGEITDYIQEAIGVESENLIFGLSEDEGLGEEVRVTLIATGFESNEERTKRVKQSTKVVHTLDANSEPKIVQREPKEKEEKDESRPFLKTEKEESKKESPQQQFTFEFTPLNEQKKEEPKAQKPPYHEVEEQPMPESNATPISNTFSLIPDVEQEDSKTSKPAKAEVDNEVQQEEKFVDQRIIENTHDERLERLKSFRVKLKNNHENQDNSIEDLEKQPAYLRKNIQLDFTPKSSDQNVSRYSLGDSDDDDFQFGKNSYLHDNVD